MKSYESASALCVCKCLLLALTLDIWLGIENGVQNSFPSELWRRCSIASQSSMTSVWVCCQAQVPRQLPTSGGLFSGVKVFKVIQFWVALPFFSWADVWVQIISNLVLLFSQRKREWTPLSPALPKAILQYLRLICKLVAGIIWRTSLQESNFMSGVWAPGTSTVTSPLPGYLYVPIDLNPSPFLTHWRLLVLFSIAVMAWI